MTGCTQTPSVTKTIMHNIPTHINFKKAMRRSRLEGGLVNCTQTPSITGTIMRNKHINLKKAISAIRRRSRLEGVFVGLVIGGGCLYYKYRDPIKTINNRILKEYNDSYTIYTKATLVSLLAEPNIIVDPSDNKNEVSFSRWSYTVTEVLDGIEMNIGYKTLTYMRNDLLEETKNMTDPVAQIRLIKEVIPNSLERGIILNQIVSENIKSDRVNTKILNECGKTLDESYSVMTKILIGSISTFPKIADLYEILYNNTDADINDYVEKVIPTEQPKTKAQLVSAINRIKGYYKKSDIQEYISCNVFAHVIENIKACELDDLIRKYIICKLDFLKCDQDMVRDIIIFAKGIPTRILAGIIYDSYNNDPDMFVKRAISRCGIIAIKLGQILSESPNVPDNIRKIFSDTRHGNTPVSMINFYHNIPPAYRSQIVSLGRSIGVGSVKQVHVFENNDSIIKVIGLTHERAEDDSIAILNALSGIGSVRGIVERIRDIVSGELDLVLERRAFDEFRRSKLGKTGIVKFPTVDAASIKCIIRDFVPGRTLSQTHSVPDDKVINLLKKFDYSMIDAVFENDVFTSDCHLGNMIYDGDKIVMIDPGQNEKLSREQSDALLWLFAGLSRRELKHAAIRQVMGIADIADIAGTTVCVKKVEKRLGIIFDDAMKIQSVKKRFVYFLNTVELEGIVLPSGLFACGKLLDTIDSHSVFFGADNYEDHIKKIFRKRVGLYDLIKCMTYYYLF